MAPLTLTCLYLVAAAMVAGGIFTISHAAFPSWITGRLLWPVVEVTPAIARMQGWAAVGFGVAVLAFSFAPFAPRATVGILVALAVLAATIAVLLFACSTWMSRRRQPGSIPPRP